jgi:hypothetical protein
VQIDITLNLRVVGKRVGAKARPDDEMSKTSMTDAAYRDVAWRDTPTKAGVAGNLRSAVIV